MGELEEQMKEMEEEDEREQNQLRGRIHRLEGEVSEYERVVRAYIERMNALHEELVREVNARAEAERELARYREENTPLDVVPLPPRKKPLEAQKPVLEVHTEGAPAEELPLGCGRCTIHTRCECFERAVDIANFSADNLVSPAKRSHSPSPHEQSKRLRHSPNSDVKPENDLEIDFTTRYPPQSSASALALRPAAPTMQGFESCGFCQDGTACLCAELAADDKNPTTSRPNLSLLLTEPSGTTYVPTSTLAPSPHGYTYASMSASASISCVNGPGTCAQCQNSPMSTLFCKSLAATRSETNRAPQLLPTPRNTTSSAPCNNPNGCCRTKPVAPTSPDPPPTYLQALSCPLASEASSAQSIPGPTLSCADTFTTLSRHPGYERAADEPVAWLPKLAAVPKGMEERTAFEVEAASVMGVLKYFDRRFGKGC